MYRADVLGSLLRPAYLAEGREKYQAGQMSDEDFKQLEDRAVDEAIALQERAGVDVVTDGEMRRFTFFDQFTAALEGVSHQEGEAVPFHSEPGKVDVDFHSPVSVTEKVKRKRMLSPEEFEYAKERATKPVKVTLPSPLMFFTMWSPTHSSAAYDDPFELFADGVELVREEARALADLGCEYIQIDAPDFGQLVEDSERERWERLGIPVSRVIGLTWIVSGLLAGLAGVLAGLVEYSFDPNFGFQLLLPIFAAVVLGGIGSVYGALLGGLVLGVAMELSTWSGFAGGVNPTYKPVVAFVVLTLALLVRPQGLFGRATLA